MVVQTTRNVHNNLEKSVWKLICKDLVTIMRYVTVIKPNAKLWRQIITIFFHNLNCIAYLLHSNQKMWHFVILFDNI